MVFIIFFRVKIRVVLEVWGRVFYIYIWEGYLLLFEVRIEEKFFGLLWE